MSINTSYTVNEIQRALFSILGSKAPGLDGFGSFFYRDSWEIIGTNVIVEVLETLNSGRILKELNNTTITLIPKTRCPKSVSEF